MTKNRSTYFGTALFFLAMVSTNLLDAQTKNVLKARKAFAEKKYAAAQKICAKGLEKQRDDYELYYIKSICEFQMSEISKYANGDNNWAKDAVKSAVKARKFDDNNIYFSTYAEQLKPIVAYNNQQALANYAQKKYAQAVQMYRNSYELTGDTVAFGMMGYSLYLKGDEMEAIKTMRIVAGWNYAAFAKNEKPNTYVREAFEVLTDYYYQKKQGDSAILYCEMGLEVFPKNLRLLGFEKQMLSTAMAKTKEKTGLSTLYNSLLEKGLSYFPSDTFFLHQQNAYYLNRIAQACDEGRLNDAYLFHLDFYNRKQELIALKSVNKSDPFLLKDSIGFMARGLEYYLARNESKATLFYFFKWFGAYYHIDKIDEKTVDGMLKIPPQQLSRRLVSMLVEYSIATYPKNKNFRQYRLNILQDWTKKPVPYYEWERILRFSDSVAKDFPKNTAFKSERLKLYFRGIDSCSKLKHFDLAWKYYYQLQDLAIAPALDLKNWQEKLAKADFEYRFKGSKIYYTTIAGSKTKKIAQTGWTGGNTKLCEPGKLPDSTLIKITNRINYFRQNSGALNPYMLDFGKVAGAQEAAVLFSNKGVFTQTPKPETHPCYTDLAATACELGMAVQESNPAQSTTILMSDKKSEVFLTRRMLTHPGFETFGVGSAENNSFFWIAEQQAPILDSNFWKKHAVTWPVAGASPAMLVFDQWSYSSLIDLSKATVKMVSTKLGAIEVTQRWVAGSAVGLPTLVWESVVEQKWEPGDKITVTIEVAKMKPIQYQVLLF